MYVYLPYLDDSDDRTMPTSAHSVGMVTKR